MYTVLTSSEFVLWGSSIISHTQIDEINILQASMKAMRESTLVVLEKMKAYLSASSDYKKTSKKLTPEKCVALIDGNRCPDAMPVNSQYIIKGDATIFSIAAASIIAKVTRDRLMLDLDLQYPQYKLAKNKGKW